MSLAHPMASRILRQPPLTPPLETPTLCLVQQHCDRESVKMSTAPSLPPRQLLFLTQRRRLVLAFHASALELPLLGTTQVNSSNRETARTSHGTTHPTHP